MLDNPFQLGIRCFIAGIEPKFGVKYGFDMNTHVMSVFQSKRIIIQG